MAKLPDIKIKVNCEELDKAIEKANRLVELLREAKQIIDSLSPKPNLTIDDVANSFLESFKKSLHCDSNHIYNHRKDGVEPTLTKD